MLVSASLKGPSIQWHLIKACRLSFLLMFCTFFFFFLTYTWHGFLSWNKMHFWNETIVSLSFLPPEALRRVGNKTFQWLFSSQGDGYQEEKQQSFFFFSGCSGWSHCPESSSTMEPEQSPSSKKVVFSACCTDFIQSALFPGSFISATMFIIWKTLSALPACDRAQLSSWQKASLGGRLLLSLWNMNSGLAAFLPLRSSSMKESDAWLKAAQRASLPGPSVSRPTCSSGQ